MRTRYLVPTTFLLAALLSCTSALGDGFIHIVRPPRPWPGPRPVPIQDLAVKYHQVEIKIKDQLAVTSIDQEFWNPNNQVLEGIYMFPVPKGITINKFSMYIDGKEQQAELLSADKARKIYEDIVRKMKDPALLEYADQKMFKLRIYPIPARGSKRVRMSYTEIVKSDSGLCKYLYPLNTEKFSSAPLERVGVKVTISSKIPLKNVYCPSHKAEVKRRGEYEATVGYEAEHVKPDKDFVVYYSHDKRDIGASILTYENEGDGYFMLLLSPKQKIDRRRIINKEVTFVLDTSGSMSGEKIKQAKRALKFCVENLNDGDMFNLIRFSTEVESLFDEPVKATEGNRDKALKFVKHLKAIGGTAIDDALTKALKQKGSKDKPRIVVFLTDGKPTIGEQDANTIAKKVKLNMQKTRVFCFGIGTQVNTILLDLITETSKAASEYILPKEDMEVKISSFYTKMKEPVLTDLQVTFGRVRTEQMYPRTMPDLFVGSQLVLTGRYSGGGHTAVTLTGRRAGRNVQHVYEVDFKSSSEDDSIARIWASRKVSYLLSEIRLHGENDELKNEVVRLAKKFGIITPYTSYLVLEDEDRRVRLGARQEDGGVLLPRAATRGREAEEAKADYLALRTESSGRAGFSIAKNLVGGRKRATAQAPAVDMHFINERGRRVRLAEQIKTIAGKTFYFNGKIWVDSIYQLKEPAKKVNVKYLSADYFKLLKIHPLMGKYLSVGKDLIVCVKNTAYIIAE